MKIFHPTFALTIQFLLMTLVMFAIVALWIPTLGWSWDWVDKMGIKIWGKDKWEEK